MRCLVNIMFSLLLTFVVAVSVLTSRCQAEQLSDIKAFNENIPNVDTSFATYLDCIEQYHERQANISKNLMESVTLCQITANNVKVSHANDKQEERDQLLAASAELCERLHACNEHEITDDFFECHAEAGHKNMLLITNIHVNATKALVDLEDRYSEAEKERLHCYLEAKRAYLTDTMTSHLELQICLKAQKMEEARNNTLS